MKKAILNTLLILLLPISLSGQTDADITSKCVLSAGPNTTYLKDHVIKLAKATSKTDIPVVKENIYLMKNFKYRFTICNAEGSKGELTVTIYGKDNRKIISSFDEKSGKAYSSIDFICNSTGMYTLWYSFRDGEAGMAVGVVSLIK
ncbi:MAG: hypothetical protein RBS37_07615 [Bacteroidales bacterium]|jgi:hypothetical protein|nr:hypothetical protein [Bacteroidales bacterium]